MSAQLTRGGNTALPVDLAFAGYIELRVTPPQASPQFDLFAVIADSSGRAIADDSVVFFNQPSWASTVELTDTKTAVRIRLPRLDARVGCVAVAINAGVALQELQLGADLVDGRGEVLATMKLGGLTDEDTVVVAEVYRRGAGWKVRAVSQGWSTGLPALLKNFGIAVEDDEHSRPQSAQIPEIGHPQMFVPPRPAGQATFQPPPGWPIPPPGWSPPRQWRPDPTWPAAPSNWQFWSEPAVLPPARLPERAPRRGILGPRGRDLQSENDALRYALQELDGLSLLDVRQRIQMATDELRMAQQQLLSARQELDQLRSELVYANDDRNLQEAGIFHYLHPLDDAVAYKARLSELRDEQKSLVRTGQAISALQQWTVNGSVREGTAMVRDFSKLMLRAYNSEADSAVRTVRPHTARTAQDRLTKARDTVARLGRTMSIHITDRYHHVRLDEIRLTAEYHAKKEEEKERAREERDRQREEEKALREFEREKERLFRERDRYRSALERSAWGAEDPRTQELQSKLDEVGDAIVDIESREANLRSGYVYVISNIGAFGRDVVKIGFTRRLEPMDRVKELSGAGVPFRFDVHAMIFSHDAVTLETRLHRHFADRRVNQVNNRKEFFYVTPTEVRDAIAAMGTQFMLEFTDEPEALEYRASPRRASVATTGY